MLPFYLANKEHTIHRRVYKNYLTSYNVYLKTYETNKLINFSYQPKCLSFGFLLPERKLQII